MCDCVVALNRATAAGKTLFGKNSDREADEPQPVVALPGAEHPPGARARCTYIEIPQVRETAGVLGTGPFWCWGLEQGVNEYGLAIGNECVFTHEELELPPEGLLGMDLVRLGLERARTARGAVDVMTALIERFGQGGPGWMHKSLGYSNGFLIADEREAWSLQTSSRRWAAKRMPELGAITNQPSIRDDWELVSDDAERFAIERGWWSPDQGRLDFEAAYWSTRLFGPFGTEGRLRRSTALLEKARGGLTESDLFRLLRDHGGQTVPPAAEKTEEAYYTLCAHNEVQGDTNASLVVAPERRTHWFALATPCTSVFLPLSLDGKVPETLTIGAEQPDPRSAWWTFKRLQQLVEQDFANRLPRVREAFDALEARWLGWEDTPADATGRMEEATARALETCHRLLRDLEGARTSGE
jgi:dipeptidase